MLMDRLDMLVRISHQVFSEAIQACMDTRLVTGVPPVIPGSLLICPTWHKSVFVPISERQKKPGEKFGLGNKLNGYWKTDVDNQLL
jgi:hypothetical protein